MRQLGFLLAAAGIGLLTSTFVATAQDVDFSAAALELRHEIAAEIGESAAWLEEVRASQEDPIALESLGHALLMQRHLDEATYLFAAAVELAPESGTALGALGLAMLERSASGRPADLSTVVALQRRANELIADDAMVKTNLGAALLRAGQASGDRAMVEEAATVLQEAAALDSYRSESPLLLLAEALTELGEPEQASEKLRDAYFRNPGSIAFAVARSGPLADVDLPSDPDGCGTISYMCERMCPGGIIGQLNRVTCEISQAEAQSQCMAGKAFAPRYNCDIEMPSFGILIPGLFPGFSILTPWGSIDMLMQGDGRIDFKAKWLPVAGRVQPFLDTTGSFDPSTGKVRWRAGAGMQYAIFNRSAATKLANEYDVGASGVARAEIATSAVEHVDIGEEHVEMRLEFGRGVVMSY
jgi:tetratricopeptide (TPR) repeat protein